MHENNENGPHESSDKALFLRLLSEGQDGAPEILKKGRALKRAIALSDWRVNGGAFKMESQAAGCRAIGFPA